MLADTISLELFRNTENWKGHGDMFLHDQFWMLRNFNIRGREFLFPTQPYLLRERRVVWVRRGWASYSFNLVDYRFVADDLVVFYGDTLVEKKENSPDFEFDAFRYDGVVDDIESLAAGGEGGNEAPSFIRLHLDETMQPVIDKHFALIWEMVRQIPFVPDYARLAVTSLLLYVHQLHGQVPENRPVSRQQDILHRFVSLVSRYAARERKIPFYAERLCVAPHYLSTLIRQVSGRTVMQWINETTVKEVKVWLAYSDETAAQISERLHFPCPASLTKFFKRETGMTPGEYRSTVSH